MERSVRAARVVTFVYFILCGTVAGMWVVHIPAVEQRVGVSHATLGSLLVLLGLGAFAGMQVSGRLVDRYGARLVVPVSGVLCSAALALLGLPRSPWTLGGALLVFGFTNGLLDVAMNAHAVYVEKAYSRPVMSAFHAAYSIGGVLASVLAAGAAGAGMGPAAAMGASAVLGVAIALAAARSLLPRDPAPAPVAAAAAGAGHAPAQKPRGISRPILILAVLALMTMLAEGAANDWSALHLKDDLDAAPSTATFGYGTFAAAMTLGRLVADRFCARFGPMAVLRHGAVTAAVGITVVALCPWIWAAFVGYALFGLGLSGCVPQLFSAAGHADPAAAGTNVSRVAGLGYVGILAGPAVIGWMTHLMSLNHAFLLLTLLCVITAAAAGVLRTGTLQVASQPAREPAEADSGSR